MKAKTIARFGLLTAVALVLSWVEHLIPIMPAVPGVKLGLANTVLLYALYLMDRKSALLLMFLKVGLTGLLLSPSPITMLISLGGGAVSLGAMVLVKLLPKVGVVPVSVAGAIGHILGQLLVVVLLRLTPFAFVLLYLPVLGVSAVITGFLTGIAAKYALRALMLRNL